MEIFDKIKNPIPVKLISLGNNCVVQQAIDLIGETSQYSHIFSWCKSYNIHKIIKMYKNDFKDLFNIRYYKAKKNILYDITFIHHLDSTLKKWNDFIIQYTRKLNRLKNLNGNLLFIRVDYYCSKKKIYRLYEVLCEYYKTSNIYLLIITKKEFIPKYKNIRVIKTHENSQLMNTSEETTLYVRYYIYSFLKDIIG